MNRDLVLRGSCIHAMIVALAAIAACNDGPAPSRAATSASGSLAPGPQSSAIAATASAASPSAAPTPPSPWVGAWSGPYRAEKVSPTLDPTVKVKSWKDDDGTRGSGEGPLKLTIDGDGEVRGTLEGPLGPAEVVGVLEGERLHAVVVPRQDGEAAFGGTLQGTLDGSSMAVQIRAADGAAVAVRSARATLTR